MKTQFFKAYLGKTCFALPASSVEEIVKEKAMAAIPSSCPWIYGVMYYKEEMIPLVRVGEGTGKLAVVCQYPKERVAYMASDVYGFVDMEQDVEKQLEDKKIQRKKQHIPSAVWGEELLFFPDLEMLERDCVD